MGLLSKLMAKLPAKPGMTEPLARLTKRERQVLGLLANGDSNKVIASKLCLSEQTIKNYCLRIYRTLNAHNRVEAAKIFWRHS
jgi:DNA-binding NarL/FixJ family response regulator